MSKASKTERMAALKKQPNMSFADYQKRFGDFTRKTYKNDLKALNLSNAINNTVKIAASGSGDSAAAALYPEADTSFMDVTSDLLAQFDTPTINEMDEDNGIPAPQNHAIEKIGETLNKIGWTEDEAVKEALEEQGIEEDEPDDFGFDEDDGFEYPDEEGGDGFDDGGMGGRPDEPEIIDVTTVIDEEMIDAAIDFVLEAYGKFNEGFYSMAYMNLKFSDMEMLIATEDKDFKVKDATEEMRARVAKKFGIYKEYQDKILPLNKHEREVLRLSLKRSFAKMDVQTFRKATDWKKIIIGGAIIRSLPFLPELGEAFVKKITPMFTAIMSKLFG